MSVQFYIFLLFLFFSTCLKWILAGFNHYLFLIPPFSHKINSFILNKSIFCMCVCVCRTDGCLHEHEWRVTGKWTIVWWLYLWSIWGLEPQKAFFPLLWGHIVQAYVVTTALVNSGVQGGACHVLKTLFCTELPNLLFKLLHSFTFILSSLKMMDK